MMKSRRPGHRDARQHVGARRVRAGGARGPAAGRRRPGRRTCPIDVARAMGVDVLIVVDAGFALQTRARLNSLPAVSNQALAILVRRDVEQQRATLGAARRADRSRSSSSCPPTTFGSVARACEPGEPPRAQLRAAGWRSWRCPGRSTRATSPRAAPAPARRRRSQFVRSRRRLGTATAARSTTCSATWPASRSTPARSGAGSRAVWPRQSRDASTIRLAHDSAGPAGPGVQRAAQFLGAELPAPRPVAAG